MPDTERHNILILSHFVHTTQADCNTTVSNKLNLLTHSLSHIDHAECMNPPGGVLRRLHGGGLKFQNGVGEEEGGDAQRGLKQRK